MDPMLLCGCRRGVRALAGHPDRDRSVPPTRVGVSAALLLLVATAEA